MFKGIMEHARYIIKNDFGISIIEQMKNYMDEIGRYEADKKKLQDELRDSNEDWHLRLKKIGKKAGEKMRVMNNKMNHYKGVNSTIIESRDDVVKEFNELRDKYWKQIEELDNAKEEILKLKARLYDLEHKEEK